MSSLLTFAERITRIHREPGSRVAGVWQEGQVSETSILATVWHAGQMDRDSPPGPSRIGDTITIATETYLQPPDNTAGSTRQADDIRYLDALWTVSTVQKWVGMAGRDSEFWLVTAVRKDDQ